MRVLSLDESAEWLGARGLELRRAADWGQDHCLLLPEDYDALRIKTPSEGRAQAGLAYLLSRWFPCEGSLLLLTVVAVFEPHELAELLSLREYYGETRWVDGVPGGATPGHLLSSGRPADQRDLSDFLRTMLAFTFEGYLVADDGKTIIWVADEVVDIRAAAPADLDRARDIVRTLRLESF